MSTNPQFPVLLNVTLHEGEYHCDVKADITGFRAQSVRVTAWDDSLVVDMLTESQPTENYYLGEMEPTNVRRIIPLGFAVEPSKIISHYNDGKLSLNVMKKTDKTSTSSRSAAA